MSKHPTTIPPLLPSLSEEESRMLDSNNISISIKNGVRTVIGLDQFGRTVHIETYQSGGFQSKSASICEPLSIDERRDQARRLSAEGLTQTEIAKRLGVSQKTIGNDLKS